MLTAAGVVQVRVWNIPEQRVVDWADVHEMVTATAFSPDGRRAVVGTMKGRCRFYQCEPTFKLEYQAQIGARQCTFTHMRPPFVLPAKAGACLRVSAGARGGSRSLVSIYLRVQICARALVLPDMVNDPALSSQEFFKHGPGRCKAKNV